MLKFRLPPTIRPEALPSIEFAGQAQQRFDLARDWKQPTLAKPFTIGTLRETIEPERPSTGSPLRSSSTSYFRLVGVLVEYEDARTPAACRKGHMTFPLPTESPGTNARPPLAEMHPHLKSGVWPV